MSEIKNAKIETTTLGIEDLGYFTCYLVVSGDGWGCGFGGYALDDFNKEEKKRIGTAYGAEFIKRILEVLEVKKWEDLPGTNIRVEIGDRICCIGHILKENWFNPKDLRKYLNNLK